MIDWKNESWLQEKYNEICGSRSENYALISMKIKRFRMVNRVFGREAGDELLETIYTAITSQLRQGEYVAYLYANCYNILLSAPDNDALTQRVVDLSHAARDIPDSRFHGHLFVGLGIYKLPEEPIAFRFAQYNADLCRAESPHSTYRNSHYEIYGVTFHDANELFLDLQHKVAPALAHNDFKLYLQPKVDLKTGRVTSAEALVRWIDPESGMIPVKDFLPGLEANGVIRNIDHYLFDQVCQYIQRWLSTYGTKIRISVNLAKCSFDYPDFLKDYIAVFEKYNIPKDCIEIELLESIILNQMDRVQRVVDEIHGYGFSCTLDDFGSGFSSYSVLARVNLATLKIDRSLFQNIADSREAIVVKHIVQTARELKLATVAEGVETQGYVDYLREIGCDYIQGFVFYRPMPVEEFEQRFLRDNEGISF